MPGEKPAISLTGSSKQRLRESFLSGVDDPRWKEPGYVSSVRLKGRMAAIVVRLLGSSLRLEKLAWENNDRAFATGRPVLFLCWHGAQLGPMIAYRDTGYWLMTSLSRDGDIQTQSLNCLGFRTIRGSSSRGGGRALLEMARRLKGGEATAMTLDGPRGPHHVAKPGAVLLARRIQAVVIAVGASYSRALRLNNWDHFEIPFPFSRAVVALGEPFAIQPETPIEDGCRLLERKMAESASAADRRLRS
ncbi:hypothetical protein AUK22_11300 [bacterium CG2_30_54_10]|nr:MAG: hypothetical protein AUK22_11300 [bacterium CG2_30_54_10]